MPQKACRRTGMAAMRTIGTKKHVHATSDKTSEPNQLVSKRVGVANLLLLVGCKMHLCG